MEAFDTPQSLRRKAEQALRLASAAWSDPVRDDLAAYAKELFERADRMEAAQRRTGHRTDAAA